MSRLFLALALALAVSVLSPAVAQQFTQPQASVAGPPTPHLPPPIQPINPATAPTPVVAVPKVNLTGKYVPNEILVKFRSGADNGTALSQLTQSLDLARFAPFGGSGWYHAISRSKSVPDLAAAFEARSDVAGLALSRIAHSDLGNLPNDTYYTQNLLWGMNQIFAGQDPTTQPPNYAWNEFPTCGSPPCLVGSSGIGVAVLDWGADLTHPDLAANLWNSPDFSTGSNPMIIEGSVLSCKAGTHGFNAYAFRTGGDYCTPNDLDGHGTYTAGIVGAVGNNNLGVVGVNWTTAIVPINIYPPGGGATTVDQANAIDFAIQANLNLSANIRVINASWGCDNDPSDPYSCTSSDEIPLHDAIQRAAKNNILFVTSAGDVGSCIDNSPTYAPPCLPLNYTQWPAYYANPSQYMPSVIAVAATNSADTFASYSNFGQQTVALAAPGGDGNGGPNNVLSTWLNGGYNSSWGTSASAPHVAGTAALMLSKCAGLETLGLKSAIVSGVDILPSLHNFVSSGGRLNAETSLRTCMLQSVSVSPAAGSAANQVITFTFNDPRGWQELQHVNFLINNVLDGRSACYVAYVPSGASSGSVYLVDDAGDAGGPYTGFVLPGNGSASNSQCTISGGQSSANGAGNTLTLKLNITFTASFAGSKVTYLAAQDTSNYNSGWQAMGTWNVPGGTLGSPSVASYSPATSTTVSPNTLTLKAVADNSANSPGVDVVDILINSALNGVNACYIAYSRTAGLFYLVNDDGSTVPAGIAQGSALSLGNQQCTIYGSGSSAVWTGTQLTVNVVVQFNTGFQGNTVAYVAARDTGTGNSGWQAMGTWQ